ncbi:hypothetical protein JA1_003259, partial [Spathaspora sp. JA1]
KTLIKKKLDALQKYPVPTTSKQLESYLGLVNFYRSLIPAFSELTAPLYEMIVKRTKTNSESFKPKKLEWSDEALKRFKAINDLLTQAPIAVPLNLNQPVVLCTDASDVSWAGVLQNVDSDGIPRLVACYSGKFTGAEKNYTIFEKEMMAIYKTLHVIYPYFVSSDSPEPKLGKELIKLIKEFKDKIIVQNAHIAKEDDFKYNGFTFYQIQEYLSTYNLPTYIRDDALKHRRFLDAVHDFVLMNNELYKIGQKGMYCRPVITNLVEIQKLFQEIHDQQGHLGIINTFNFINQQYYIPKLYDQLYKYIQTCHECQVFTRRGISKDPMYISSPGGLFHTVACDTVHMNDGYIIVGRDEFSGWVEARYIPEPSAQEVASFIKDEFINRHGMQILKTDNGSEFNNKIITKLLYGFEGHSGYNQLINRPVSNKLYTREELFKFRFRQFTFRENQYRSAEVTFKRQQQRDKDYHDIRHKIDKPIEVGQLVLVFEKPMKGKLSSVQNKSKQFWAGPFRVHSKGDRVFTLEELDGENSKAHHNCSSGYDSSGSTFNSVT